MQDVVTFNLNSPRLAAGSVPWGIFKEESAALPLESPAAVSYRGERNLKHDADQP